jgi:PhnB protein
VSIRDFLVRRTVKARFFPGPKEHIMAVKYIPAGERTIVPHLAVSDAPKAIEFYKKVFGAEELTRAVAPDGKVMHCALQLGDSRIYVSDQMGQMSAPGGFAIQIWTEDPDKIFDRAVKAGATARMPLADMFWGDRYGQVQDPFGVLWSLAKHLEDLTPEQMKKRSTEFFAKMGAGNCAG